MTHSVRTCLTLLEEHVSTCLAELVAHLGIAFIFYSGLVTHSRLLGLYELVTELLALSGPLVLFELEAELLEHLEFSTVEG